MSGIAASVVTEAVAPESFSTPGSAPACDPVSVTFESAVSG